MHQSVTFDNLETILCSRENVVKARKQVTQLVEEINTNVLKDKPIDASALKFASKNVVLNRVLIAIDRNEKCGHVHLYTSLGEIKNFLHFSTADEKQRLTKALLRDSLSTVDLRLLFVFGSGSIEQDRYDEPFDALDCFSDASEEVELYTHLPKKLVAKLEDAKRSH